MRSTGQLLPQRPISQVTFLHQFAPKIVSVLYPIRASALSKLDYGAVKQRSPPLKSPSLVHVKPSLMLSDDLKCLGKFSPLIPQYWRPEALGNEEVSAVSDW